MATDVVKENPNQAPKGQGAPHQIAALLPLALIAISTAFLLWGATRCTGPLPTDRCPLAGTANTNVHVKN